MRKFLSSLLGFASLFGGVAHPELQERVAKLETGS
jgi:hypothetical protein